MAGHSHAKNVFHRKSAQNAKKASVFTKILREISLYAKEGTNPEYNAKLRAAISQAKSLNVPNDNIARAIEKKVDKNLETVEYEIFLGKVAFIIKALTDNRNRTVAEVKKIVNKYCATLGNPNSTKFLFDYYAVIECNKIENLILNLIIDFLENIDHLEEKDKIYCTPGNLANIKKFLKENSIQKITFEWKPKILINDNEEKLEEFINAMSHNDDIINVWHNHEYDPRN